MHQLVQFSFRFLLGVVVVVCAFLGGWVANDRWNGRYRVQPTIDLKSLSINERLMRRKLAEEQLRSLTRLLEMNDIDKSKSRRTASESTLMKMRDLRDDKVEEIDALNQSMYRKRKKRRGHVDTILIPVDLDSINQKDPFAQVSNPSEPAEAAPDFER